MRPDSAPVSGEVQDHESGNGGQRIPAVPARNPCRNAGLHIKPAEQLLEVGDHGLELDDQQNPGARSICEHVDAPAISEIVEADLDPHEPAQALEIPYDALAECGMARVAQLSNLRAAVSGVPPESNSEG